MSRILSLAVASACTLALTVAFATNLHAQAVGAGANVGFYNLNGEPFEEVDGGFGYEVFIQLSPGGGGGAPPMGGGMAGGGMGFGGGGFSLGIGMKRTFHDTSVGGEEVDTRTIFIAPGLNLSPTRSRVRLSVRTRLSPFARVDFGQDPDTGDRIRSDGFEVGGAVGSEIFLLRWLAVEPSVYGSYLNLEDPASEAVEQPFPLPGFGTGDRLQGWSLGFRLGLNLLVR